MKVQERCYKDRTEKIIFRVKPEMKHFVKEYAEKLGLDISDFMRMMLEWYYMAYFTGEKQSYQELREKFFKMYPNGRNK